MVGSETTPEGDLNVAEISEAGEGLDLFAERDESSETSVTSSTMYDFGVIWLDEDDDCCMRFAGGRERLLP